MNIKPSCVESFCGAGGMAIGLKDAGYDIKYAFDLSAPAIATYKFSVGHEAEVADASTLPAEHILEKAGLKKGELKLFAGGPPCQGFSKQRRGAHFLDDPRNNLILNYVLFVQKLKPHSFMLENVAVFGQLRGQAHLQELARSLPEYKLYPNFYNSADYGLAQTRERFVLVGIHRDYETDFIKPPKTHNRWLCIRDIIGDLPEPPLDYTTHPDFANHQRARVTKENIERFSHVPQGGGWKDIPYDLRLACHKRADVKSGGWPDVYGRLKWDGQCPTITGGFDSFSRGRYGHPLYDRPLTPREAARLQGFPDKVHFQGTRQDVRYQIGNAVPPPVAKAVAEQILQVLDHRAPENQSTSIEANSPRQPLLI